MIITVHDASGPGEGTEAGRTRKGNSVKQWSLQILFPIR
jgi:hypothetical protein